MMMLVFLCACSSQTETEKHLRSRSKVVKVKDRVKEIDTYKIHVFDLKGNYQQTLDVGYKMRQCTYDKTHHRLFMVFNDEIQFGYLDLKGIL